MVLEMAMESLFAVVDIFFVSRLGDEAMAGVALTESAITIIYTVAVGLSIGVTAMVARRTGEGDAAIAMRVLWIANGLNIVLDPLLIFGFGPIPALGLQGAAIATTIGRGVAVLVQIYTLAGLRGKLRVRRPHLRVQPAIMARLVRLSGTGTLQTFIGTASWIGLIRVTSSFGAEALAGYVIAVRVILFAILPAWGLAERAVWISCKLNFVFLGAVSLLFIAFAPAIVSIFGGTGEAREVGVMGLRIVSIGFVFYAYGMVLTAAFNGAGAVWTPTILNLFCFWLWEIPLAWILAFPVGLGPNGVFIAMTVSFSTLAVVSAVLFKRGKWKLASV